MRLYTIGLEDVAATERLEPTLRVLKEIDCADSMYRVLSLYYSLNKKPITNESTGEWQHAAPETNADRVVQLVCQAKPLPAAPASPAAKPGG